MWPPDSALLSFYNHCLHNNPTEHLSFALYRVRVSVIWLDWRLWIKSTETHSGPRVRKSRHHSHTDGDLAPFVRGMEGA